MKWTVWMLALAFFPLAALSETYVLDGPTTKPSSEGLTKDTPGLVGVFFGHVPCEDCHRTKMLLILFKDPNGKPKDYTLERIGVGKGNDRHITKGSWKYFRDPPRPGATIYRLDAETPEAFRTFWAVDSRTLLVLGRDSQPLKGGPKDTYTYCVALFSTF